MENYLVMPITIIKGAVFEDYILIPDAATGAGQDLTNVDLKAELRDKPGGNLLATFTCTKNMPPPNRTDTAGWVQLRLDDSTTTTLTAYRGTWSLLAAKTANNYDLVAAGIAEIPRQATA